VVSLIAVSWQVEAQFDFLNQQQNVQPPSELNLDQDAAAAGFADATGIGAGGLPDLSQPMDAQTAQALAAVGLNTVQQAPVQEMIFGFDALRQSGLFKRRSVGGNERTKILSLPPPGTPKPKGQCYNPARSNDGVLLGGLTCCIPSSTLQNVDVDDEDEYPLLGGIDKDSCRAALMSRGSRFDGQWCVTTQYADPTCRLSKIQAGPRQVLFEVNLMHNEPMNNVICRCMISQNDDDTFDTITDIQWEVSADAVLEPENQEGAQALTFLSTFPMVISESNVAVAQSIGDNIAGGGSERPVDIVEGQVVTGESFTGDQGTVDTANALSQAAINAMNAWVVLGAAPVIEQHYEEQAALAEQGYKPVAASGVGSGAGSGALGAWVATLGVANAVTGGDTNAALEGVIALEDGFANGQFT